MNDDVIWKEAVEKCVTAKRKAVPLHAMVTLGE
jgi:hypothetical protein